MPDDAIITTAGLSANAFPADASKDSKSSSKRASLFSFAKGRTSRTSTSPESDSLRDSGSGGLMLASKAVGAEQQTGKDSQDSTPAAGSRVLSGGVPSLAPQGLGLFELIQEGIEASSEVRQTRNRPPGLSRPGEDPLNLGMRDLSRLLTPTSPKPSIEDSGPSTLTFLELQATAAPKTQSGSGAPSIGQGYGPDSVLGDPAVPDRPEPTTYNQYVERFAEQDLADRRARRQKQREAKGIPSSSSSALKASSHKSSKHSSRSSKLASDTSSGSTAPGRAPSLPRNMSSPLPQSNSDRMSPTSQLTSDSSWGTPMSLSDGVSGSDTTSFISLTESSLSTGSQSQPQLSQAVMVLLAQLRDLQFRQFQAHEALDAYKRTTGESHDVIEQLKNKLSSLLNKRIQLEAQLDDKDREVYQLNQRVRSLEQSLAAQSALNASLAPPLSGREGRRATLPLLTMPQPVSEALVSSALPFPPSLDTESSFSALALPWYERADLASSLLLSLLAPEGRATHGAAAKDPSLAPNQLMCQPSEMARIDKLIQHAEQQVMNGVSVKVVSSADLGSTTSLLEGRELIHKALMKYANLKKSVTPSPVPELY